MRKSVEETWKHLEAQGDKMPREPGGRPFVPLAMPSYDDEQLGYSFFRTGLEGDDLSNLTLARTFFGRSGFERVSFADTDLSESRMCWNDFVDCDFSGADLSGCDMRATTFRRCKFAEAVLRSADLRRSTFEDCDFTGADLVSAVAEELDFDWCIHDYLTPEQQAALSLTEDEGPEPPGG